MPDAGRVAPISGSVLCLRLVALGPFIILQKLYLPSILHLTQTRYNSLIISTLLSVRYCQFHLHVTYTAHTLQHSTSTGGGYHSIGEQKSLLLRLIFLRPGDATPIAYVQIGCEAAGVVCKMCAGVCKIL